MIFITKKLSLFIQKSLEKEISLLAWASSFLAIMAFRVFIEQFLAKANSISVYAVILQYVHNIYFFLITFILLWFLASFFIKINPKKLAYLILWGSFLVLLPPIIDMIKTGGEVFWSFYILSSLYDLLGYFLTFFGHLPTGIIYFGTKIVFSLAIIVIGFIILAKTEDYLRTILGAIGAYVILFFMGVFPSIFLFLWSFVSGGSVVDVKPYNIAQFFGVSQKIFGVDPQVSQYAFVYNLNFVFFPLLIVLLSVLFFVISRKKFWAVVRNLRFPQTFYHSGLFFIGIGLGYLGYRNNFQLNIFSFLATVVLLISVWLAWASSVVMNDIYDFGIDSISNPERPLPRKIFEVREYAQLGVIFFLLSLLGAVTVGFPFAVLILVYTIWAWFYSAPPFRFKKFPLTATLISSLALIMILFLGYILMSSDQTIHSLSWRIILLLLIAYTISLPIKDFKDIEGDKKYGIWTIPVLLGEKKGRLVVAINLFISYILSVFFLNELKLFWWAMLFGTLTFLVVISPKIKPRQLFWPVLGLVFFYGLILVKIVFMQN